MKKLIISFSIAVVLAAGAVTAKSVISNSRNEDTSFLKRNVEALSAVEKGKGVCYKSIKYIENTWTLYCGECLIVEGKPKTFSGTGKCN